MSPLAKTNLGLPPVVTEEGEEECKLEQIVSWIQDPAGLCYQVHWKAYSNQVDMEEPAEKFTDLHELKEDFLKCEPPAPVPANYAPHKTIRQSP